MHDLGEKKGRVRHAALPAITQTADDRQGPHMLPGPHHEPSTRGNQLCAYEARTADDEAEPGAFRRRCTTHSHRHKRGEREHKSLS